MLSSQLVPLKTQLETLFSQAIQEAFPQISESAEVTQSTQEKFGHYQCNTAMRLGKALKKNPREIASAIVERLAGESSIEKLEIAGPGFINITLTDAFLQEQATSQLLDPKLGISPPASPQTVVIDFSSPNVAKELHVGHLRSTIIGESLARLMEELGHNVLRLNHIGDWGTQFGMLITYLIHHQPLIFSGEVEAELPDLMYWYREAKKIFDQDPAFKKQSQEAVIKLQGGDSDSLRAWGIICEISRRSYQEIYDLLGVKLQERGESFYNSMLADVIKSCEAKGIVQESDGAKCIFLDGYKNKDGDPLPMILRKSDGGFNYATTDMAALRHRVNIEKADRIIYVIDLGQKVHIDMVFEAAEKAEFVDRARTQLDYVGFGVVLGPDGKKFKTRSGDTERLIDLLNHAVEHATGLLKERLPTAPPEEIHHLAEKLGINAIKYSDLSCHRQKDYVFSYDRMLRFEGNTAAFLLYSYVRIQSIKRKVGIPVEELIGSTSLKLAHPSEKALALHLRRFPEALSLMDRELLPNRLTDYLYTLAEKFNAFYRDCPIVGAPEQNSRLQLIELAARIMEKGFYILSLEPLSKM